MTHRFEYECEWSFVSICLPCDDLATPRSIPPMPDDAGIAENLDLCSIDNKVVKLLTNHHDSLPTQFDTK